MSKKISPDTTTLVRQALAFHQIPSVELIYRQQFPGSPARSVINSPQAAYKAFINQWDPLKIGLCEQFKVALLSHSAKLMGICDLTMGGVAETTAPTRFIIALGLLSNACFLVLAHNHPSGSMNPSPADIKVTKTVAKAAELFGITIYDHLIVQTDGYYSFKENGHL